MILDDILDAGHTLAAVRTKLEAAKPRSIRVCVLLSKRKQRVRDVDADYIGFEIDDEFVVGYGLDFMERYRNLPYFGVLRKELLGATKLMKVRVQFYAQLRDLVGMRELELEIELPQGGATVCELLEKIYAQRPALRAHDKSILVGAGREFVDRNYKLNPGEEIKIMPPVQGG